MDNLTGFTVKFLVVTLSMLFRTKMLFRGRVTGVATRCVDPGTQMPHTVGMIEKSMVEIGFSVNTSKSAKVSVSSSSFRRFVSFRLVVVLFRRFVSSLCCFVLSSFLVSSRRCVVLTFSHFVVCGIVV